MTDERLKLWFGFVLVVLVIVMGVIIAIGDVRAETSFGLRDIIAVLGPVIGAWAAYEFGGRRKE